MSSRSWWTPAFARVWMSAKSCLRFADERTWWQSVSIMKHVKIGGVLLSHILHRQVPPHHGQILIRQEDLPQVQLGCNALIYCELRSRLVLRDWWCERGNWKCFNADIISWQQWDFTKCGFDLDRTVCQLPSQHALRIQQSLCCCWRCCRRWYVQSISTMTSVDTVKVNIDEHTLWAIPIRATILNNAWPSLTPLCALFSCVKPRRATWTSHFPLSSSIQEPVMAK